MKTLISSKKIILAVSGMFIITLLFDFTPLFGAETKEAVLSAPQKTIPEYYMKPYVFTTDWFTGQISIREETLAHLKGKPDVNYLEIGVFEGRSLIWMLENILTNPSSKASAVDIFVGDEYKIFLKNLKIGGFTNKVTVIKGYSQIMLRKLPLDSFDVIYIDGSHKARDVLTDAVLSWDLLKVGGIMIFHDYTWARSLPPASRPEIAIDAFIEAFQPCIEVLHKKYEVVIKKNRPPDQEA